MSVLSMKQMLRLGLAGLLSPVLLAGMSAPAAAEAPHCPNEEILIGCFGDNGQKDALALCGDYIASTPEHDGCLGGSRVIAACGSTFWEVAAYYCPE